MPVVIIVPDEDTAIGRDEDLINTLNGVATKRTADGTVSFMVSA